MLISLLQYSIMLEPWSKQNWKYTGLFFSITIHFQEAALSQPLLVESGNGSEYSNDPVFYGPDGNVLTDEERAFLWNVTSCPHESESYDEEEE